MRRLQRQQIGDKILSISIASAVIVFILMPFLYVFKESLVVDHHFSLTRVVTLLTTHQRLLVNTLQLGVVSTLLQTLVAVAVAVTLYLSQSRWRRVLLGILFVTLISPPFVTSLAYINLFGRRGLITYGVFHLSLNVYGMWGIAFMQMLSHLSLNVLVIAGFLEGIRPDVIAAARNLGAGTNAVIKDVILPQAWIGAKVVAILAFFRSIADFGTPAIIGGKYSVLALESYLAVIAEGDLAKAATMNLIMLLPALFIVIGYRHQLRPHPQVGRPTAGLEVNLRRTGGWYWTFHGLTLVSLGALVLLYAAIILSAFTQMRQGALVWTLANFRATQPYLTGTLLRSVLYSLLAATVGSLLGLLLGYYAHIRQWRFMTVIDALANLPYIIPGTFFGLGYLLAFNHAPLLLMGTAAIVVLNVTFKQLPFSARVGAGAMEALDGRMLDAVHALGGGHWDELRDVIFPLSRGALRVAFINAFTSTMTTMGSIIFLVYPAQKVLTLVMFDAIQSGKYQVGSVIALVIMLVCLTVNGLFYYLWGGRYVSNH